MDLHIKKMIAPIIISVLLIIYYLFFFFVFVSTLSGFMKFLFGIIPLILAGTMIYVCLERINEIRRGEEDDISKY